MKIYHPTILFSVLLLLLSACTQPSATQSPTDQATFFTNTTVTLTFDDGYEDTYGLRDVLLRDKLRATFYIVSGFVGDDGYLTREQIQQLAADGNDMGGHTLDHVKVTEVRGADLRREICQDRLNLLSLGLNVTSFAFPFGHYDAESKQTVIDCGYNSARIVTDGPDSLPPGDAFALQSMPFIVKDTDFSKMQRYVKGAQAEGGGWVILIFHHICNACDQYAIDANTFSNFADWLAYQRDANGLVVKTIGEVIGGAMKPGVKP